MTRRELARRSLAYYFRTHLGALAGSIAAAAVLIGALAVGDSVRESLKSKALERLAGSSYAIATGDRFFGQDLVQRLASPAAEIQSDGFAWVRAGIGDGPLGAGLLVLPGSVSRQDGAARINRANVIGVLPGQTIGGWTNASGQTNGAPLDVSGNRIGLNPAAARQLNAKVGDTLVIRVAKPSALSRDAIVTPRDDQTVALRGIVGGIVPGSAGGNLSLLANQADPINVFVALPELSRLAGIEGRANLLLMSAPRSIVRDAAARGEWRARLAHWARANRWNRLASWITGEPRNPPTAEVTPFLESRLRESWELGDAELSLAERPQRGAPDNIPPHLELATRRIFLEPAVAQVALASNAPPVRPTPLLTYLVNSISRNDNLTPYSMVTAVGAPYTPADLQDDEIVVNDWLARDLGVKPGDRVDLAYYRVDAGTRLIEHTNTFRVHSIVSLSGLHADKTLMPEFPGLAKAESTRDWDAGFDLVHPIRDQDEAYWKQWRGTPKAFISLAAGQKLWANRFGDLTAIRWFVPTNTPVSGFAEQKRVELLTGLEPANVGLVWQPIRESALKASTSGQDFGGLFIGFSFFLIVSALLLTSMLFQFGLDQRATEVGILLALGWPAKQVRRLLFREGLGLAALGALLGAVLGTLYARGVIWGLSTLWKDAVAGAGIEYHLTAGTLALGLVLSLTVAAATLGLALRRQARLPARQLLNQGAGDLTEAPSGAGPWLRRGAVGTAVAGFGLTVAAWTLRESRPETFFGAGALLLVAALLGARWWLAAQARPREDAPPVRSLFRLAQRGLTRRPSRSVGTLALLASAAFMIVAVAANRLDATRNARQRSSGTGGFAYWGESTLPILEDLNTRKGQEFFGLDPADMTGVSTVGFRVRDGDDASCLNLNRAQRPRLLGVDPAELARRGAFTFTRLLPGITVTNGWLALEMPLENGAIPAIGDANSIQWALGKKIGDTLEFVDERGQPFRVKLVGAVANSILQGSLVIPESAFVQRFPGESGRRVLLIDAPPDARDLSARLTRALQDVGLELTPTATRLDQFNAVQNTYLNTFQVLGGLGLLLGSVGLGVVVLRNVFERRGELALMQAVGFAPARVRRLILVEHLALLLAGLGTGGITAAIAVLPALFTPGSGFPTQSLALTLAIVFINGLIWTVASVHRALSPKLVDALKEL